MKIKLIKSLIEKKIELYQNFQNQRHYLISAWNLHIAYLVCVNLIDSSEIDVKSKNELFSKMFSKIFNEEYEESEKILYKINELAQEELKTINEAISKMDARTELLHELGDINPEKYRDHCFVAVSSWDAP